MKTFAFLIAALTLVGCASVAPHGRNLHFERLWVKELPYDDRLGPERYQGMTPLVVGDTIYQGNGKDAITALSRTTGREKWHRLIRNGVASGATLYENGLYFGASDGQFYCLNPEDGSVTWAFPVRSEILAPPLAVDGVIYFLSANNVVYALDAKTGKQKWLYNRTDTTTFSIRGGARPTVYKDRLYIGFSDGFFVALNTANGNLVWERSLSRNAKFKDVNATAVLDGDSLFVCSYDDALYKLSAGDGQILWRIDKGGYAPVTLSKNRLYFSTSDGELLCLDKDSGSTLWSIKLNEGVATQPVVFNEFLIYGESRGDLKILNSADGRPVASYASGRGLVATPTVDSERKEVFFISNTANLYALRLRWDRATDKLPGERQ